MLFAVLSLMFACQEREDVALTCEFNGISYAVGESFDSYDDCNSCYCDTYEGETSVSCTEMDCSVPEELDCADLSVTDCASRDDCAAITASQIVVNTEEECLDWANSVEDVGCMDANMGCGAAITYAASAADPTQCYGFYNTCIPAGWGDCNSINSFTMCDTGTVPD